jgi:hypothetical protein
VSKLTPFISNPHLFTFSPTHEQPDAELPAHLTSLHWIPLFESYYAEESFFSQALGFSFVTPRARLKDDRKTGFSYQLLLLPLEN